MTPKRKSALEWIHGQGEVTIRDAEDNLSGRIIQRLLNEGIIDAYKVRNVHVYSLTDKGRRALHGDANP